LRQKGKPYIPFTGGHWALSCSSRGDGETFSFCILILVVEGKEMDPFDWAQVSVLNKVGLLLLIHSYFCFWSISSRQISPSEIIMSWMSFASGIYFLVVPL
jgi:hypothetical protein